jgi:hypothetical protein
MRLLCGTALYLEEVLLREVYPCDLAILEICRKD